MSNTAYKRNDNAMISGTYLQGYVRFDYYDMVRLFGDPVECDEYKVSGEWVFESNSGEVFTVYDWKSTNLYHSSLPSVEAFRSQGIQTFNIGGRKDPAHFIDWLSKQLRGVR